MLRKLVPYVPYLLVIIGLIVAIVLVVANTDDKQKKAPAKKQEASKTKTAGSVASSSKPAYEVRTSPANATTATASKNASSPKPATGTPKNSGQLAETGPAETIALFFATVVVTYGAHSYYIRQRI